MKQKDISEKILEDYNDVFADIINGLIFDGKSVVHPEDLDASGIRSQYKADTGKLHEQERDVEKFWNHNNGMRIAVYGLENQTEPDPMMPVRVFSYEGADYRSQLLKGRKQQNEKNTHNNKNIDQKPLKVPVPVMTLILYYGTERHWNTPKRLKQMITIPEKTEELVNDIKINVFEIAWLTDEEIKRFHSDFRVVANFFAQKKRNKKYVPDDKTEIVHVDAVLKFLSAMTGDNSYESLLTAKPAGEEKEIRNMCDVAQRLINQGRTTGLAEGKNQGLEEGRAEGRAERQKEIISDFLQAGMDPDRIAAICHLDPAYVSNLKTELQQIKNGVIARADISS